MQCFCNTIQNTSLWPLVLDAWFLYLKIMLNMYWIMCNFQEAERMFQTVDSETVHLPYERSDVLEIPVKALKYRCDIYLLFKKVSFI